MLFSCVLPEIATGGFLKKVSTGVFCEICEIYRNTYFVEYLGMAASLLSILYLVVSGKRVLLSSSLCFCAIVLRNEGQNCTVEYVAENIFYHTILILILRNIRLLLTFRRSHTICVLVVVIIALCYVTFFEDSQNFSSEFNAKR